MSFTEVRKALAEQKLDEWTLPCRHCGEPTSVVSLSSFGALCDKCFAQYCRTPSYRPERSIYASEALAEIARKKGES